MLKPKILKINSKSEKRISYIHDRKAKPDCLVPRSLASGLSSQEVRELFALPTTDLVPKLA